MTHKQLYDNLVRLKDYPEYRALKVYLFGELEQAKEDLINSHKDDFEHIRAKCVVYKNLINMFERAEVMAQGIGENAEDSAPDTIDG